MSSNVVDMDQLLDELEQSTCDLQDKRFNCHSDVLLINETQNIGVNKLKLMSEINTGLPELTSIFKESNSTCNSVLKSEIMEQNLESLSKSDEELRDNAKDCRKSIITDKYVASSEKLLTNDIYNLRNEIRDIDVLLAKAGLVSCDANSTLKDHVFVEPTNINSTDFTSDLYFTNYKIAVANVEKTNQQCVSSVLSINLPAVPAKKPPESLIESSGIVDNEILNKFDVTLSQTDLSTCSADEIYSNAFSDTQTHIICKYNKLSPVCSTEILISDSVTEKINSEVLLYMSLRVDAPVNTEIKYCDIATFESKTHKTNPAELEVVLKLKNSDIAADLDGVKHLEDKFQLVENVKQLQVLDANEEYIKAFLADNEKHTLPVVNIKSPIYDNLPSTSSTTFTNSTHNLNVEVISPNKSVVASTHDISAFSGELKLTESELQLGKVKPYWIPDVDCSVCMLCSARFTIVNRRHHCRSCGRVLCGSCCQLRRVLPYMLSETDHQKQRICTPCNKTLDRIEIYEKFFNEQNTTENAVINDENVNANSQQLSGFVHSFVKRKKSVLKVRTSAIDSLVDDCPSPQLDSLSKSKKSDNVFSGYDRTLEQPTTQFKRNVTFRDGVNPGNDFPAYLNLASENDSSLASVSTMADNNSTCLKKMSKKMSRKSMERRMEEENLNLLGRRCGHIFCVKNFEADLVSLELGDAWTQILDGYSKTIAIRRNLYVIVEITDSADEGQLHKVLSFSTRGFNSIGADELIIAIEWRKNLQNKKVPKVFLNATASVDDLNKSTVKTDKNADEGCVEMSAKCKKINASDENDDANCLLEVLHIIEFIFSVCISISDDSTEFDDRLGIRHCSRRMTRLFGFQTEKFMNIKAAGLLLHRPAGQNFGSISIPSTPFFVGTLLKKSEILWARCVPNRLLFAIGKQSGCYPTPVVNACYRESVLNSLFVNFSVLKILNDFKTFSYKITFINGSNVSLSDSKIEITIPKCAEDLLKTIIETNRNMIGWALDFNENADSHLVCIEENLNSKNKSDSPFQTQIFARDSTRNVTGTTFVIFDGALKTMDAKGSEFTLSVVEDGVIIRLTVDAMINLVKNLLICENFFLQSTKMSLNLCFVDKVSTHQTIGALVSPIDGENLTCKYQYGLVFHRSLRSLNYLSTEWAVRLGSVINMSLENSGKFPTRLQSKYFEICEQLTALIANSLNLLLSNLIQANRKSVAIRVQVNDECAMYKTEKWEGLENEHLIWLLTLDEQVIPYLYSLSSWASSIGLSSTFHVELHLLIVSIRPLPYCCVSSMTKTELNKQHSSITRVNSKAVLNSSLKQ